MRFYGLHSDGTVKKRTFTACLKLGMKLKFSVNQLEQIVKELESKEDVK